MIIVDRIREDLRNVYNCYESAAGFNPEDPRVRMREVCFYPGIFEIVMMGLIPYNIVTGLYRYHKGTLFWDEFSPVIQHQLNVVKYSPIYIIAAVALAARHSGGALTTLAGVYLIKPLFF